VPEYCNSKSVNKFCLLTIFSFCVPLCAFAEATKDKPADHAKASQASVQSKRDSVKLKGGYHLSTKVPTNFPLPVYSSNVLDTCFENSTKGTPTAALNIITKDSANAAFEWYKTQCAATGWQVRMPKESAKSDKEKKGQLFILNAIKGEQRSIIMCSQSTKHPKTVINITWMKHI
jgi:hypothetical protein